MAKVSGPIYTYIDVDQPEDRRGHLVP
jgi:hypothetical protein